MAKSNYCATQGEQCAKPQCNALPGIPRWQAAHAPALRALTANPPQIIRSDDKNSFVQKTWASMRAQTPFYFRFSMSSFFSAGHGNSPICKWNRLSCYLVWWHSTVLPILWLHWFAPSCSCEEDFSSWGRQFLQLPLTEPCQASADSYRLQVIALAHIDSWTNHKAPCQRLSHWSLIVIHGMKRIPALNSSKHGFHQQIQSRPAYYPSVPWTFMNRQHPTEIDLTCNSVCLPMHPGTLCFLFLRRASGLQRLSWAHDPVFLNQRP